MQKVAQAEFKHSRTSVAEAAGSMATVGAASLSLIVPVAEAVPEAKVSLILQSYPVVGTETVPVVAPAGTVTVCEVV
jgi:hypothetical protein